VRNGRTEFVLDGEPGARPDLAVAVADGTGSSFSLLDDGPARRVRRTWLDTFDWRLYRAGLTLEELSAGGRTQLILTGRDGEQLAAEQAVPVGGRRDVARWPALAAALPPGPLRELLDPVVGVRALLPVVRAASQVREQRVLNSDAKTVARLTVEQLSVGYPAKAQAAPRVCMTAVRGYQSQAGRVGAALAAAPGVRPGGGSALDAALAAARREPARAAGVELTPAMPAAAAMAMILTALLDAAEENVPGTIKDIDTEFLHDLRVAVRRTRSALKLTGRVLPDDLAQRYGPEFGWVGDLTTPTRDLDVYLLGFDQMAAGLVAGTSDELAPFRRYLERTRVAAHRQLARGLRSARFARLTADWRADLAAVRPARRRPAIGQLAGQRIAVAQRRALGAGQRITASSPAGELHDLRKRCKELRYLLEMFGSLHDPAQRWQVIRELKALQDCLGEFQDTEVQRDELHAFADQMLAQRSAPAATLLAMGEIAAGLARRQRQARIEFDGRFAAFAGPESQARLTALTQAGP
jgi:CHAD domain-containing protein